MILGYRIEASSSGRAIRGLLQDAILKYKPGKLKFLTDGGSENVNKDVSSFFKAQPFAAKHIIAQKDVVFSNSMVEAVNKIMKHQFLYHKETNSERLLKKAVKESVIIYNTERPQMALGGSTPFETFNNVAIDFVAYKAAFAQQKAIRLSKNKKRNCRICP